MERLRGGVSHCADFQRGLGRERRRMMALLRVEHLTKSFHGNKAVDDVTFEVHRGEIVALLGENGAGKSTVIKMLAGVHEQDSGTIELDSARSPGGISF